MLALLAIGVALPTAYTRGFNFDVANREVEAYATLDATSVGARAYEYVEKRQGYFTWAVVGTAHVPSMGNQLLVAPGRVGRNLVKKDVGAFAFVGAVRGLFGPQRGDTRPGDDRVRRFIQKVAQGHGDRGNRQVVAHDAPPVPFR